MPPLLIVRTHLADKPSLDAFARFSAVAGLDVTFVCDELNGLVDLGDHPKIAFDGATLDRMGLYRPPRTGWRCGDYFYYVAREQRPQYEQYWMLEPDVMINVADLDGFFETFANIESDMLAVKISERDETWAWYPTVAPYFEKIFGCIFPLSRLSARAIDAMYAGRREASTDPARANPEMWPNDESFVTCTVVNAGFKTVDFNDDGRTLYTMTSFSTGAPFDIEDMAERGPDERLYHPVRDTDTWIADTVKLMEKMPAINSRGSAMKTRKLARAFSRKPETLTSALIPLVRGADALLAPSWAGKDRAMADSDAALAKTINARIKEWFTPDDEHPQIGQAHAVRGRANPNAMFTSGTKDFELGPPYPIYRLPVEKTLPYAWDEGWKALLCTLHLDPSAVLAEPFVYGAQRRYARVAARIPRRALDEVFGEPDPKAAPIFVFSIGRTGSTLFNGLLSAVVPRSISEPDTLTQLATARRDWIDLPPKARARLLWHSFSGFYHTKLDQPDDGTLAIKLRSQVNSIAGDLAAQFPAATFVFMIRERTAWARSTYRSFGQPPETVGKRLLRGIEAIEQLKRRAKRLHLISYEEMVSDPVATIAKISGRTLDAAALARIDAVMNSDSQSGTRVARDNTKVAKPEEEAWMSTFDDFWAANRPAETIERLALPF